MTVDNLDALLAAHREELSAIYENVPGIMFYIAVERNDEFRFLSVSRDFLTATGLRREQVVGSLVREVIPAPSLDLVLNHYREAIRSGQPVRWEETSVYPAGQRYGEVAVTPLYDASGVATHLIGIVHDVTERKRLEERHAADLLEAAPDAMVVVDQAGRVVLVNAQTETLFGYRREEMLGRNVEFLIPARFQERHQAHRVTFFSEPRVRPMGANLQLSGLRKNGTEFPVEVSLSPIHTSEGILVTSAIRDISERKLAEEARLRLAAIVESSDDAIASGTLDGIILSWNAGAERMYGYTESEAVGKPITILVPPELLDEEDKIYGTLKAGGRIEQFETVRVTKTGKRINVSLSTSAIKDPSGVIVGCCGIASDITARKRAEEALHESEERLRLAVQAGKMFAYSWDAATDVIERSGESADILGVNSDQAATGTAVSAMVHPGDKGRLEAALTKLTVENPMLQITYRITCPDGVVKWLERNSRAYFDANGKLKRIVGMITDVTDRKLAEESLSRYAALIAASEDAIIAQDLDGIITSWNAAAEHIFGYTASEIVGHPITILIPPDLREEQSAMLEMLRAGERVKHYETIRITKAGKKVDVSLSISPIKDASGKVVGFSKIARDISERKRTERSLTEMTRKLIDAQEHERARIARELHDDITQKLAMLSVEMEQRRDKPSEMAACVEEFRRRISEISIDVQTLSHDLHSSKLEYLGAIAGMKSWCKEFAGRQKVEIDFNSSVSSALPYEIGLCLFRVLQEALSNAIKHSGEKQIEVALHEEAGEIHLTIRDFGKGFDVETARKGRGLGLTSMQERVRLLNGNIEIQSAPMKGTTLHIRLPFKSKHILQAAV